MENLTALTSSAHAVDGTAAAIPLGEVTPSPSMTTRYGRAALAANVDRVERAPTGGRHEALFAAACEAGRLAAGGELDGTTARTELLTMAVAAGFTRADAERQVDRGMLKGSSQPKRAPDTGRALFCATDARAEVLAWWAVVAADPELRTRTGTTTLRILAAFALLGMASGKVRLSDSYRQVAEVAGVSPGTLTKHLAALDPYVRRVTKPRRSSQRATTWQLIRRAGHQETTRLCPVATPPAMFPDGRGHALDAPGHNFWHRRSGWWVLWCALDSEEPATVAELAQAAGRSTRTVRRVLATFLEYGLVTGTEGAWTRAEAAPEPLCETDHAEVRRDRHAAERAAWSRQVALLAARRQAERDAERDLSPEQRTALRRERRLRANARRLDARARRYERQRATGRTIFDPDPLEPAATDDEGAHAEPGQVAG